MTQATIMTCDADCTRAGWQEALAYFASHEMHISYGPGINDHGERFDAFNHDMQAMESIPGYQILYLIDIHPDVPLGKAYRNSVPDYVALEPARAGLDRRVFRFEHDRIESPIESAYFNDWRINGNKARWYGYANRQMPEDCVIIERII